MLLIPVVVSAIGLINVLLQPQPESHTVFTVQQVNLQKLRFLSKLCQLSMWSYLESLSPNFLSLHTQLDAQARQSLESLRATLRSTESQQEMWRLQDAMLRSDSQVLKDSRQSDSSSDVVHDWLVIRREREHQFEVDYNEYIDPSVKSGTLLDTTYAKATLLAVLLSSLSCWGAVVLILRKQIEHPLRSLRTNCFETMEHNGLTLAHGTGTDILQVIGSSVKLLGDTVDSLNKHEKAMIDNAVDMICWLDAGGKFQKVNPSCKRITGYTEEELHNTNIADYVQSEDASTVADVLNGASKSTDLRHFENWFKTKRGQLICLRWSVHWSVSEGALFCIAHDITERKIAERLLEEKEAELRLLFESLPAGVLVVDQQMMQIELNNSFIERMLGCKESGRSLAGAKLDVVFPDLHVESILTNSANPASLIDENACTCSGERIPVQIAFSRFATHSKWLLVISDMSSKVAIETMKREFVAMVGHDLRTPLTSIRSFLDLLLIPGFVAKENHVGAMIGEIERLMKLVNDLLDVEKMRSGKFEVHVAHVQLCSLIDASVNAVEHIAKTRQICIQREVYDGFCMADGARTIQVLVNLLSNALKFSARGSNIVVGISEHGEHHIAVYVKDWGRGVPLDQVDHIFEKFGQVYSTDATEKGGSGLGLHICKTIVVEQGGEIWVRPNPEGGTVFYFSLRKSVG